MKRKKTETRAHCSHFGLYKFGCCKTGPIKVKLNVHSHASIVQEGRGIVKCGFFGGGESSLAQCAILQYRNIVIFWYCGISRRCIVMRLSIVLSAK